MAAVMDRWVRESLNALELMKSQREEHEAALEAAMAEIRRRTQAVESLEQHIAIVEQALQAYRYTDDGPEEIVPEVESQTVRRRPPQPPPLRAVPTPPHLRRATGS